jgi:hypothetical protein
VPDAPALANNWEPTISRRHLAVAVKEFRRLSGDALGVTGAMGFLTWNDRHKLHHASLNVPERVATGFSAEGAFAIRELARDLRRGDTVWRKAVTLQQADLKLGAELRSILEIQPALEIEEAASRLVQRMMVWAADIGATRRHAIPITLLPHRLARFEIGPVGFVHRDNLDAADLLAGPAGSEVPTDERHRLALERIDKSLATRSACWIALVTVSNRERDVSTATANNAVDIALGALQAMAGVSALDNIGRVGGRLANWDCYDTWFPAGGDPEFTRNGHPPGFAVEVGAFETWLAETEPARSAAGQCLHAYLAGEPFPRLHEAWCEAAYWYHEAMAEHLDTMRIARLETSLEVLLRAEKTSGSTGRILTGLQAILGIDPSLNVGVVRTITIRELVEEMVRSRSRVLHGTWPTLGSDLPGSVPVADLAALVRRLIGLFAVKLELYTTDRENKDDVVAFLTWVQAQRENARAL